MGVAAVAVRDLHRRKGELRLLLALPGACAVTAVALYGVYRAALDARRGVRGVSVLFSLGVGRVTVHLALFVALLVCCAVLPAAGAASIAGERERGTLLPLLLTRQRPLAVVVGKVLAVFALAVALVAALAPLLVLGQLLGGVGTTEILRGVGMVLAAALLLSALSVAASARCRRASTATAVAYGLAALLVLGSVVVFGLQALASRETEVHRVNHAVLAVNPFVATADVLAAPSGRDDRLPSPFTPFVALIGDRVTVFDDLLYTPADGGGFNRRFRVAPVAHPRTTPFWRTSALAFAGITAVSVGVAARRLRLPRQGAV